MRPAWFLQRWVIWLDDVRITIEAITDEIVATFARSGLQRGQDGAAEIAWTFGSNPAPFAVARIGDEIVGISAYIQHRMTVGREVCSGFQAVDSFVFPAARGRGIFARLATAYEDHLVRCGADLVWGFPNANAAPVWFGRLGWTNFGQLPFMVKPLRASYVLRRLGLAAAPASFTNAATTASATSPVGDWVDVLWSQFAGDRTVATRRDMAMVGHRLLSGPHHSEYHVATVEHAVDGALVATRLATKHGGRIAYIMEAFGGRSLPDLLQSEIARLRNAGAELALAWCLPHAPNRAVLRRCGFVTLPERLRPIRIWFGAKPLSNRGALAADSANWYLSYLDSDTV